MSCKDGIEGVPSSSTIILAARKETFQITRAAALRTLKRT